LGSGVSSAPLSRVARAPRALLAAAAIAAAAAAFDVAIGARGGAATRVLLHDASASCGARAPGADELDALVEGLGGGDRVAVVAFGSDARIAAEPCAPADLASSLRDAPVDPHGSSLAAALRAAARVAPPQDEARRLEILLVTDGLATDARDAVDDAALALRAAGCSSFRVILRVPGALPDAVATLRGPGVARVGEPISLQAAGVAANADAVVELSDASRVLESRRVGAAGPFRMAFTRIEETAGAATFSARVAATVPLPPATARVIVRAPGRALVLTTHGREGAAFAARDGDAVEDLRRIATDARAVLEAYDAVVVDDAADEDLPPALVADLAWYASRGGGVVLLGGPHSFGSGGWAGRPVESLSPLTCRPPGDTGTFAYVALDGSGSMGEPWDDARGAATRDAAVRAAARALVDAAGADTSIAIRRFAADLLPTAAEPPVFASSMAQAARARIDAMEPPGGATALLPPLREALRMAGTRPERRKAAIVLTDGRTLEPAADLHAALASLDAAGVRVTFVLPGAASLDEQARPLRDAIAGTKAEVRGTATPEALAEAFRAAESRARVEEPVAEDRRLAAAAGAEPIVVGVPASARRVNRVWAADGARVLVATERGEPVAALRRAGLGTVAALATRAGDAEWLAPDPAARRLVAALVGAVARTDSSRVRVERGDDGRVLVRAEVDAGAAPARVEWRAGGATTRAAPLVAAGAGLLAAQVDEDAPALDVVAADGTVLATAGLDRPAPPEYRGPRAADLDAVASLACGSGRGPPRPLLPWLAGAAVVLALASVAAARVKSAAPLAR
jgi:VWA domain-containing protein